MGRIAIWNISMGRRTYQIKFHKKELHKTKLLNSIQFQHWKYLPFFSLKHLYTNTVLDGTVILCVCSFAIETTFPFSSFQTKHIFGILMVLRKYEDHFGRLRRPIFFFYRRRRHPNFFFLGAKGDPSVAPMAALPGRARETPPKAAVSRVYKYT